MELQPTTVPLLPEPQPTLVDPSINEREKIRKYFPKILMIGICILQISCGILVSSCQAIAFFTRQCGSHCDKVSTKYFYFKILNLYCPLSFFYKKDGPLFGVIWGMCFGGIFATTGIVGIIGAFRPSRIL